MKKPEECSTIEEIDRLDRDIIELIDKRIAYLHLASKRGRKPGNTKTTDYVKNMLEKRRQWAEQRNLNPDIIEAIFSTLIGYYTTQESDL